MSKMGQVQIFEKLARKLIDHFLGFENMSDENYERALNYVMSNLMYHHCLDVNSHTVEKSVADIAEKMFVRGQAKKSRAFKEYVQKLMDLPCVEDEGDLKWSLLSFLINLSQNPSEEGYVPQSLSLQSSLAEEETTLDETSIGYQWLFSERIGSDSTLSDWSEEDSQPKTEELSLEAEEGLRNINSSVDKRSNIPSGGGKIRSKHGDATGPTKTAFKDDHEHFLSDEYLLAQDWLKDNIQPCYWDDEHTKVKASEKGTLTEYVVIRETLWLLMKPASGFLYKEKARGFCLKENLKVKTLSRESLENFLKPVCEAATQLGEIYMWLEKMSYSPKRQDVELIYSSHLVRKVSECRNSITDGKKTYSESSNVALHKGTLNILLGAYSLGLRRFKASLLDTLNQIEIEVLRQDRTITLYSIIGRLQVYMEEIRSLYAFHAKVALPYEKYILDKAGFGNVSVDRKKMKHGAVFSKGLSFQSFSSSRFLKFLLDVMNHSREERLFEMIAEVVLCQVGQQLQSILDGFSPSEELLDLFGMERMEERFQGGRERSRGFFSPDEILDEGLTLPYSGFGVPDIGSGKPGISTYCKKDVCLIGESPQFLNAVRSVLVEICSLSEILNALEEPFIVKEELNIVNIIREVLGVTANTCVKADSCHVASESFIPSFGIDCDDPFLEAAFRQPSETYNARQLSEDGEFKETTGRVKFIELPVIGDEQIFFDNVENAKIKEAAKSSFTQSSSTVSTAMVAECSRDTLDQGFEVDFKNQDGADSQDIDCALTSKITPIVYQRLSSMSSQLSNILLQKHRLKDHFSVIYDVMLLEAGHLMQSFVEGLFVIIDRKEKVSEADLTLQLRCCVSETNFGYLSNNFSVKCGSGGVITMNDVPSHFKESASSRNQLCKESRSKTESNSEVLSNIFIKYSVNWPFCLILDTSTLNTYSRIFAFIVSLKRGVMALEKLSFKEIATHPSCYEQHTDVSIEDSYTKSNGHTNVERVDEVPLTHLLHRLHLLRQWLLWLARLLHDHFTTNLIHPFTIKMKGLFKDEINFGELIQIHEELLYDLCRKCMLTDSKASPIESVLTKIFSSIEQIRSIWCGPPSDIDLKGIEAIEENFLSCHSFLARFLSSLGQRNNCPHVEALAEGMLYNSPLSMNELNLTGKVRNT